MARKPKMRALISVENLIVVRTNQSRRIFFHTKAETMRNKYEEDKRMWSGGGSGMYYRNSANIFLFVNSPQYK